MPVNEAELIKDLDDPKYLKIVSDTLATKKITVLDETARTTMLDNHKKDVIEKEMKTEVEKIHTQYDNDLKLVFGDDYKRNDNEKSYEALKRVGTAKIKAFNEKIATLEDQIKKGDPTGALTKKLADVEEQAKNTIEGLNKQIGELKTGNESAVKQATFTEVYSKVKAKFVKALPAMFTQTEKAINSGILANAVLKDGVLYVGDGLGNIKKDTATFKEITVESVLETEYKDVIDTRKKQGGSGSGSGTGKDPDHSVDPKTVTKDNFELPGNVKEPGDLMDHLIEIGVPRGTKQFTEIWNKYVDAKSNKLREGVK